MRVHSVAERELAPALRCRNVAQEDSNWLYTMLKMRGIPFPENVTADAIAGKDPNTGWFVLRSYGEEFGILCVQMSPSRTEAVVFFLPDMGKSPTRVVNSSASVIKGLLHYISEATGCRLFVGKAASDWEARCFHSASFREVKAGEWEYCITRRKAASSK